MIEHLGQISARASEQFGEKTALIFEDRRFNFVKIDRLASQLAGGLAAMGVGKGDIVTL